MLRANELIAAARRPIRLDYHPLFRGYLGGRRTHRPSADCLSLSTPHGARTGWARARSPGARGPSGNIQGLSSVEVDGLGSMTLKSGVTAALPALGALEAARRATAG